MKKTLLSLFIFLLLGKANSQIMPGAGQLKVTIESVKCNNKSWDGFVEFDGHGTEVMVNFAYRIFNPANVSVVKPGLGFTRVFGSNVNGQIKAGTQTPNLGGIANGDNISINQIVLNERLGADDVVLFAPTLWEVDDFNDRNTINLFNVQLANDLNWAVTQPYPFANIPVQYFDFRTQLNNRVIKIFDKYRYGQAIKYHNITKHLFNPNAQGNRPIGANTGVFNDEFLIIYPPTLLVLDTRILNGLSTNNRNSTITGTSHAEKESKTNFINGVDISYIENTYNIQTSNGNYSIAFKIEFTPDNSSSGSTSGITGSPTKNIGAIKKDFPTRNININNTNLAIAGNWAGIQTNDYGLYPQNIAFELTANGEYLIKDVNGVVAAKGAYTFSNNLLSGSYKQVSSSEMFSFSAMFDPATQKISGSLGAGTAITGQGKWTTTKK